MKGKRAFRTRIVALVCIGLLSSQIMVLAADPLPQNRRSVSISDVALAPGGMLTGQVVDRQGIGQRGTKVAIRQQGREVVATATDPTGYFTAAGLRGGTFQILADDGQGLFRLWTANTAPPAAKSKALIVTGDNQVLRGQFQRGLFQGGLGQWVLPALAVGGIATGVTIAASNNTSSFPASP